MRVAAPLRKPAHALVGLVLAGCAPPAAPADVPVACDDWVTAHADRDGDGYGDPAVGARRCAFAPGWVVDASDCDDADATLGPAPAWYPDADGDGDGTPADPLLACAPGPGWARTATDCDDADPAVYTGQAEWCDGHDGDCDPGTGEDGVATLTTDAGVTDVTAVLAGTAAAPAHLALDAPGTLAVCAGTWYAHLVLTADVAIVAPSGVSVTTLHGGDAGTVLTVTGEGTVVEVADVTITGGRATAPLADGRPGGGGLRCGEGGAVFLADTRFVANTAEAGGAVASEGCWVHQRGGAFTANTADEGGAIWIAGGHFELEQADVTTNAATTAGGAILIATPKGESTYAAVSDTVVSANTAPEGGAVVLRGDTELIVYGTGRDRAGLLGNVSDTGGALRVEGGALVELVKGDLGEPDTPDDNLPADITTAAGDVSAGDDRLGWCTSSGCRWLE